MYNFVSDLARGRGSKGALRASERGVRGDNDPGAHGF